MGVYNFQFWEYAETMVNVVDNDEYDGGGTNRRVQVNGLLLAVLTEPGSCGLEKQAVENGHVRPDWELPGEERVFFLIDLTVN